MKLDKPGLLIIDVQKGFDLPYWGVRNNPNAEANMEKLLQAFRKVKNKIYHVKHNSVTPKSPLRPAHKGNEIKDGLKPENDEPLFIKTVNSAFIGTDLEEELLKDQIKTLVIMGLTTDHCVSTSARMAGNFGFQVYVVSDATATFNRKGPDGKEYSAEKMHEYALVSLNKEFATIADTKTILSLL